MDLQFFSDLVDELSAEVPDEIYKDLNGGIIVHEEAKLHPKAVNGDLYIMGEYCVDKVFGRTVVLYYGSFEKIYAFDNDDTIRKAVRKVLRHELRHHVESMAGDHSLEEEDVHWISQYLREHRHRPQ